MEQRTKEWYEARRGRVTASQVSKIMAPRGLGKTAETYAFSLIADEIQEFFDDGIVNFAMQHGIDTEPIAREAYEAETMREVKEDGFITKGQFLGCSPDGLVGKEGLIEIKCPQPENHLKYLAGDECPKEHYDQIQFQMYVTGRKWCDFVTFNNYFKEGYQMKIIRVEVDAKWVELLEKRVDMFYRLYRDLRDKIINK